MFALFLDPTPTKLAEMLEYSGSSKTSLRRSLDGGVDRMLNKPLADIQFVQLISVTGRSSFEEVAFTNIEFIPVSRYVIDDETIISGNEFRVSVTQYQRAIATVFGD
jgi:hypothetical protein